MAKTKQYGKVEKSMKDKMAKTMKGSKPGPRVMKKGGKRGC